jgi:hypothetical protein
LPPAPFEDWQPHGFETISMFPSPFMWSIGVSRNEIRPTGEKADRHEWVQVAICFYAAC